MVHCSQSAVQLEHSPRPYNEAAKSRAVRSNLQIEKEEIPLSDPSQIAPFHLAIEVKDLESSRQFYGGLLGFDEGRSSDTWIDYDFMGHQVVVHVSDQYPASRRGSGNPVDGKHVPVPHFGVVLSMEKWRELAAQLRGANVEFVIEPYVRFEGEVGEQATMFFLDPSGNALEFKAFADMSQLFAK